MPHSEWPRLCNKNPLNSSSDHPSDTLGGSRLDRPDFAQKVSQESPVTVQ
jgi:hypothetical protein